MEEQLINEQTELTAQHATAEEELMGATEEKVSFGKFKDVNALLNAYNSLQSEFTKRCQKVKELEGELATVSKAVSQAQTASEKESDKTSSEEQIKEDVLKEYLLGVLANKPKAVVLSGGGAGVKTPVHKPKTIEQAGQLAKEMLSKN